MKIKNIKIKYLLSFLLVISAALLTLYLPQLLEDIKINSMLETVKNTNNNVTVQGYSPKLSLDSKIMLSANASYRSLADYSLLNNVMSEDEAKSRCLEIISYLSDSNIIIKSEAADMKFGIQLVKLSMRENMSRYNYIYEITYTNDILSLFMQIDAIDGRIYLIQGEEYSKKENYKIKSKYLKSELDNIISKFIDLMDIRPYVLNYRNSNPAHVTLDFVTPADLVISYDIMESLHLSVSYENNNVNVVFKNA